MISRPASSAMEAYAAGVRGWACEVPKVTVHVVSDSGGPIERAMETLPALAIDRLSIPEAYRLGRALRFIGFVLDENHQRLTAGEQAHRVLRQASQRRAASGEPYTAEQLTTDFLNAFALQLSNDSAYLRERILTYADTNTAFRRVDENVADLGREAVAVKRRALDGFSHPRVETLTQTLLPLVPSFHVSGPLYDDLEQSGWTFLRAGAIKTGLSFCIVVDGKHWLPLSGDPDTLARTEYLLVDARAQDWVICERVWMRARAATFEAVQTFGIEWNAQTHEKAALVATARYELTGSVASRSDFSERDQNRMLHVTLGFLALLTHDRVMIRKTSSPPQSGDHFVLELPGGLSVERVVEDLNARRHRRQHG